MKNLAMLLVIIILYVSCEFDSGIAPVSNASDEELTTRLVNSEFKSEYYEAEYQSNGTFIEKKYIRNDLNNVVLWYTYTGNYIINNSILSRKDCQIEFSDSTYLKDGGLSIIFFDSELSVRNNNICFGRITLLDKIAGESDNIWGSWETLKWAYHFVDKPRFTYQGRQKYYYNFYQDSVKVNYGWEYLDDISLERAEFNSDFIYLHPHLEMYGSGEYNITVSFENNKMYWRYENYDPELNKFFGDNCIIISNSY